MRKIIAALVVISLLAGCKNPEAGTETEVKGKVLFITSNQHTYGKTKINTANHFAEIVLAYDVFVNAGYKVDFMSPEGGAIPIGYINTSDSIQKKYLYDFDVMNLLKNTYKPDQIIISDYRAVYYSGGGAAMFGVPENVEIQNISIKIYENSGVISAICHGTAGIVNLKTAEGAYVYEGKQISGFPDLFENKTAAYYQEFPFSIEEAIRANGGNFAYSEKGWDNYYKVDGRIVTGQDPTASASVAEKIIEILQKQ